MAASCEYINSSCPTSNNQIPTTTFEKQKKKENEKEKKSSLHLFQLLTIDIDTQRPTMWYHEVSGTKKERKYIKKTATKS